MSAPVTITVVLVIVVAMAEKGEVTRQLELRIFCPTTCAGGRPEDRGGTA